MWVLIIMLGTLISGFLLNNSFEKKYGFSVLHHGYLALQTVFVCILFLFADHSWWLTIAGIIGTVFSYYQGVNICKSRAIIMEVEDADIKKIIAAQILIPIGAAITVILILGWIMGSGKKRRRR